MKFKKVLIGVALAVTCLMSAQAQRRHEIQVPNPDEMCIRDRALQNRRTGKCRSAIL